jgi:hypothetical protein
VEIFWEFLDMEEKERREGRGLVRWKWVLSRLLGDFL